MKFDTQKFETTNFKDRVEPVPVPRLAHWFELKDEESPVWRVRGLTGLESAIAKQEVTENQKAKIEAIMKAIGSKAPADIADAVKEMVNANPEKVPDELVQRYSWLKYGSVDPVCTHDMAMKLAVNFPEDFYLLTNKIMQLTGMGRLGE